MREQIDKMYSLMIYRTARWSGFGKMASVKGKVQRNPFSKIFSLQLAYKVEKYHIY